LEGKDYLRQAAWTLALYPQQLSQQPAAAAAVLKVAIWLAPAAAAAAGVADAGPSHQPRNSKAQVPLVPASAGMTAMWISMPKQQQQQQQAAGSSNVSGSSAAVRAPAGFKWPSLEVGPGAAVLPVRRPVGGAMLLQVHLRWQGLISGLSLIVRKVQQQHNSSSGSSTSELPSPLPGQQQQRARHISNGSICWQPVAVYSSRWGGVEQVTIINTTAAQQGGLLSSGSSSSSSSSHTLLAGLAQLVQPLLRAGVKASTQQGSTAALTSSMPLWDVAAGTPVLLLLDPACEYSISLKWDIAESSAALLLNHASAAAGMVVALLLLVLSHQMSALVRLMTAAREGPSSTPQLLAAAAAAARTAAAADVFDHRVETSCSSVPSGSLDGGAAAAAAAASAAWPAQHTPAAAAVNPPGHRSSSNSRFSPQHPSSHNIQTAKHRSAAAAAAAVEDDVNADRQQPAAGPGLKALSLAALQRIRRQMNVTLGGAPPPLAFPAAAAAAAYPPSINSAPAAAALAGTSPLSGRKAAAAAAASSKLHLSSQPVLRPPSTSGVSVIASLQAVTSDARVALLAGLLSAAVAAGLNETTASSSWSSTAESSSSSRGDAWWWWSAAGGAVRGVLQLLLAAVGLLQRGASPGLVGCVLLLAVALVLLVLDVAASVAVKWCLDGFTAAVQTVLR
jgi:hypothetical protein